MTSYSHSNCAICDKHDYLVPLHGDSGGPLCCILCVGDWHGKHGRRRRLGRIVIRAMNAYLQGGGSWCDIDKLKLSAISGGGDLFAGVDPLGYLADTANTTNEIVELTSELLADAIRLAHPDQHPPERQELAHRVSKGLLALQPFVFPAPQPKLPAAAPEMRNEYLAGLDRPCQKAVTFPCKECADSAPYWYCTPCRAEYDKLHRIELDRASARRRELRAQRRAAKAALCATCGTKFQGKREDARFCSDTCRQRAHRKHVTDKRKITVGPPFSRDRSTQMTEGSKA
jgi:hypothetical protein